MSEFGRSGDSGSPPQQEEGWPKAGVVWSRNSWNTPPRLHGLMRLRDFFLIVQPPLLLLRRGAAVPRSYRIQTWR